MKIIVAHNRYLASGGEDEVFSRETALLESGGHRVHRFTADNSQVAGSLAGAARAVWNTDAARRMGRLVRETGAELVHVHNTFAFLSPAILRAAHQAGAAVVVSLHNFRLHCVNAMLYRQGQPCRRCLGLPVAWPGIAGGCYRDSHALSATVAAIAAIHRMAGTWSNHVDRYLTPSASARSLIVEGGLPAAKVGVKPNFTEDRHHGHDLAGTRAGAVLVGRVIAEKGALVAAEAMAGTDMTLTVIGDGGAVGAFAGLIQAGKARCLGRLPQDGVAEAMRHASVLVAPSPVFETFGLVVAEAFSAALPAIVANHGGLAELVEDGKTGLLVRPGDAADLAAKLRWAQEHPEDMRRMGENARRVYTQRFTPEANLPLLEAAYAEAIRHRRSLA